MSYEPFKCPDCSVWWRGETHKCVKKLEVKKTGPYKPYESKSGWINCPACAKPISKYNWHTCKSYDKLHEEHRTKKNGNFNDYPEGHGHP